MIQNEPPPPTRRRSRKGLTAYRTELQRLHVGTVTGPAGTFPQTTPPGVEARRLHDTLRVAPPPKILHLDTEPEPGPTTRR